LVLKPYELPRHPVAWRDVPDEPLRDASKLDETDFCKLGVVVSDTVGDEVLIYYRQIAKSCPFQRDLHLKHLPKPSTSLAMGLKDH
jgi:hypothetical protein